MSTRDETVCDRCGGTFADFNAFYRHCTEQVGGIGRCPEWRKARMSKLLTSREVAERFRVDVTSVRRWVAEGKLKVAERTPGGYFRFSEDDVNALAGQRM